MNVLMMMRSLLFRTPCFANNAKTTTQSKHTSFVHDGGGMDSFITGASQLAQKYSIYGDHFKGMLPIKGDEPIIFLWSSQFNCYNDECNFFTGVVMVHDSGDNPGITSILEDRMSAAQYESGEGWLDAIYCIMPNSNEILNIDPIDVGSFETVFDIEEQDFLTVTDYIKERFCNVL